MRPEKFIFIGAITLVLAACGNVKEPNKENFAKAIQAYLDKQNGICAPVPTMETHFTLSNKNGFNQQAQQRADALVEVGLLTKRDSEIKVIFSNKMEPATEYQVSQTGKNFLLSNAENTLGKQDAFCTGKYTMVDVENFTEPSDAMGMKVSSVNFRYKVDDIDDWAKHQLIVESFKNIYDQIRGDIKGKAALVLTDQGWIHERLFNK